MATDRIPVAIAGPVGLLPVLQAKLLSDNVFASTREVPITLNGDPDSQTAKPPADRFLSLWFKDGEVEAGLQRGGGRDALTLDTVLEASLWQRMPTDVFGSDEDTLLLESKGYYVTLANVVSSLEQFDPPFPGGLYMMLSEPMRLLRFRTVPRKGGSAFARVVLEFSVNFRFALPIVPLTP